MDGGRDLLLHRVLLAIAAFGSVAKALFSCSSLASRKAVDFGELLAALYSMVGHVRKIPHLSTRHGVLALRFDLADPNQHVHFLPKNEFLNYHSAAEGY